MSNGLQRSFRTGIMWQPSLPKAVPLALDFSAVASFDFDLELDQTSHGLDFVQTIYARNTDNANALHLTMPGGQVIDVPAGASGYYPVAAEWGKFTLHAATTIAGGLIVNLVLLNVPCTAQSWGPVTVNANVTASATPVVKTAANNSSTIAAAGTSQQLFAANALAFRRIVVNPPNNVDAIYINFGGVAAAPGNSICLLPGQSFDTGIGPIDQTQWTVNNAATAAALQPYVAKEFV